MSLFQNAVTVLATQLSHSKPLLNWSETAIGAAVMHLLTSWLGAGSSDSKTVSLHLFCLCENQWPLMGGGGVNTARGWGWW